MIIQCDRCYARYRYDEARFEGHPSKKVRCTKCMAIFEVQNPARPGAPAGAPPPESAPRTLEDTMTRVPEPGGRPPAATTGKNRLATEERKKVAADLKLPANAKLSLAVISGPEAGRIFSIDRPKVVIGREDVELVLNDPEISRHHAAIEVSGDRVTLLDLGSTNGTFMDEEPVTEALLENQAEFTVGGSTLMLIITRPS